MSSPSSRDPLRLSFHAPLQQSKIAKSVCQTHECTRGLLTSNVGQLTMDTLPYGVVLVLCIGSATRLCFSIFAIHTVFTLATDCITVVHSL